jgi:hypothetical protein
MAKKIATILGCGVEGAWIAHHLVSEGYHRFVLFSGAPDREDLRRLGPFEADMPIHASAAEALATHLRAIAPKVTVEIHGRFNPDLDANKVRGDVVGALSTVELCARGFQAAREAGGGWISLGIPSDKKGEIVVTDDYRRITQSHLAGETRMSSREEISKSAALAASELAQSDKGRAKYKR